jgi:hypothetical protein
MTFDEFENKLKTIKVDFEKTNGRSLITVKELEEFLLKRKVSNKRSRGLKSLKGFLS